MIYIRSHNENKNKGSKKVAVFCAVVIVIVAAIYFLSPHFFPGIFTAIARPFWRTEFSISSGQLKSQETILAENQELQRKLDESAVQLQSVSALQTENDQLKALMGRASTTDKILAAVLKKPPFAAYDELLIDAGADYGFSIGNIVYAPGEAPIGKISEVLANTSKVILFSSPGQKYDVTIGSSSIPVTAYGRGGGSYSAELPRDTRVLVGDFVTIPSIKSNIYARISKVLADPSQPFETVLFAPPINVYQLRWVLVDKKSKQ